MRMQVQSLTSLSGLRSGVAVSCGVGCRCSSDPALLWLWHRPAAVALIQPLAWELPCTLGAALKKNKNQKKKKERERDREGGLDSPLGERIARSHCTRAGG